MVTFIKLDCEIMPDIDCSICGNSGLERVEVEIDGKRLVVCSYCIESMYSVLRDRERDIDDVLNSISLNTSRIIDEFRILCNVLTEEP